MAKYRSIKTQFWTDPYVQRLSGTEKLVFLYLLSNPLTKLCGIYEISIRTISFEIGFSAEEIEQALYRLSTDCKIVRLDDWIYVVNFAKHQQQNPSVKQAIERELLEIPENIRLKLQSVPTLSTDCTHLVDKPILKEEPILKPNLNSKSASRPPQVFQEGSEELRLSTLLLDNILAFNPRLRLPDLQKWSAEVDKMLRIDKRSVEEIETLIIWVSQDTFWKANILSTAKLREKFDQVWSKAAATQQGKERTHLILK